MISMCGITHSGPSRAPRSNKTVNPTIFGKATLAPGEWHMTYWRICYHILLNADRLIYLDCDTLVFRDLAELFDLELAPGKVHLDELRKEHFLKSRDCYCRG